MMRPEDAGERSDPGARSEPDSAGSPEWQAARERLAAAEERLQEFVSSRPQRPNEDAQPWSDPRRRAYREAVAERDAAAAALADLAGPDDQAEPGA